jgi:hypothetical protein
LIARESAVGTLERDIARERERGATKKNFAQMQLLVEIMLHNSGESVQLFFRSFLNSGVIGSSSATHRSKREENL